MTSLLSLKYALTDFDVSLVVLQWLQMYSLLKLKLDLTKLVSGPDCRHVSKPVRSLGKRAEAKYACELSEPLILNSPEN